MTRFLSATVFRFPCEALLRPKKTLGLWFFIGLASNDRIDLGVLFFYSSLVEADWRPPCMWDTKEGKFGLLGATFNEKSTLSWIWGLQPGGYHCIMAFRWAINVPSRRGTICAPLVVLDVMCPSKHNHWERYFKWFFVLSKGEKDNKWKGFNFSFKIK